MASPTTIADALGTVRDRTLALIAPLDDAWVTRTPAPIMSPPAWDLAHIAAYEELWLVTRLSDAVPLHPDLQATYDAFETPRAVRGDMRILDADQSLRYMADVRRRAMEVLAHADLSDDGPELTAGGFVWHMVAQHEAQHDETLLQTLQLMPAGAYAPTALPLPDGDGTGLAADPVDVAGGTLVMGAAPGAGALDCEQPPHERRVAPFRIDRNPVTIGRHLAFIDDGGYAEPRHWSTEGWEWRQREAITAPLHWHHHGGGTWTRTWFGRTEELDPREILCHVSFHEAEAHARWAGARLPTEDEWEFAARRDPASACGARAPWGDDPADGRANLGQSSFRPARVGAYPAGVAASGCAHMLGDVWEWTSTEFHGYPGFRAFPYREYAEPFFREGYRVLRGGSWATQEVAARTTFRNWDLPQRRQIFAGLRLAWDAA